MVFFFFLIICELHYLPAIPTVLHPLSVHLSVLAPREHVTMALVDVADVTSHRSPFLHSHVCVSTAGGCCPTQMVGDRLSPQPHWSTAWLFGHCHEFLEDAWKKLPMWCYPSFPSEQRSAIRTLMVCRYADGPPFACDQLVLGVNSNWLNHTNVVSVFRTKHFLIKFVLNHRTHPWKRAIRQTAVWCRAFPFSAICRPAYVCLWWVQL